MEKRVISKTVIALIIASISFPIFAQKTINIDNDLRANSTIMSAKRKGAGSIGKYEFGPYKIISGKGGVTKTTRKSGLLSNGSQTKSENNKSFVFVGNEKDTVRVNTSEKTSVKVDERNGFVFNRFFNWNDQEVVEGMDKFNATFSLSSGSNRWDLLIIYPVPVEIDGAFVTDQKTFYKGMMTDGSTEIEIKQLDRWSEGKTTILNPALGYEFYTGTTSIAAVQMLPINKMLVWINNDLNEETKLALATAIASLMVRTF